ncbi:hypothetical protein EI77_02875 [Prosthecobacter fusiformis]|uniref:Methyltransferase family protein n=1 Tax=Prosthecobacter fusiformis TaxID=48464 RepID=A0A4R7RXF7_9BACT|nr:class I SAM-dependent methyltransferase [Prosthecobacter fusiformis]TDU69227.1 hypothetical protein EI77_02875 [Prosthecobacter fusiformis]
MNKYLRNFLLNSRIPMLAEWGALDLRKKHLKRHAAHQKEVFARLYDNNAEKITVLNGPFKGMRYINEGVWGSITPKWIGSYENELWPVIQEILQKPYRRIIDVGCADGYYAVGFARALPEAEITAYDQDPVSRDQTGRLWELNGRPGCLKLGRWCDHAALQEIGGAGSLVFCDIEGGEMDLLDPARCPALKESDILVEVHKYKNRGNVENADELTARFQNSHSITRILDTVTIPPLSSVESLAGPALEKAVEEGRTNGQIWLWMVAGK